MYITTSYGPVFVLINFEILKLTTDNSYNLKYFGFLSVQFSGSVVSDSLQPYEAACQASLSITNFQSLLKLMSIESVIPSSHLILCRPLLLLPPIPPSIMVFSNESTLRMRCPKYWSFSFSSGEKNKIRFTFLGYITEKNQTPLIEIFVFSISPPCVH